MKKGRILHVDTPGGALPAPQNVFVKLYRGIEFLRGLHFPSKRKKSIIELCGGILVHTLDKTKKRGEKVVVAIRPEVLSVDKGRRKKVNVIFGQAERLRFERTNIWSEIRLENEDLVVVVCPAWIGE